MEESTITEEIRNNKIIAVEGAGDVGFFVALLKKMKIKGVYVTALNGKNNFNKDLPDLQKRPGFSDVTHFAIIRDKNGDDAFKSVCNILVDKMNFANVPVGNGQFASNIPRVGIFIMPGDEIKGNMIEDLCLKTVEGYPAMVCVNEFASGVSKLEKPPKSLSKTKTQAFLAAQENITNTIGLGAQKGYWDLDSSCLDELKAFLENMR